jgi:DNA-binding ferritin-like protein (Dps family)
MRKNQYIKEINQYKNKLKKENQERFDEILLSLRYADINDQDAEEFTHHCLDLFLQAECEGIPIEEMLNTSDLDAFCQEFIKETKRGYSVWQKLYWQVNFIPIILLLFTAVWEMFAGYLLGEWAHGQMTLSVPVTISMVVDTLLVIVLVKVILQKRVLAVLDAENTKKDKKGTIALFLGFCLMTGIFLLSKFFLSHVLFHVNFLAFLGVVAVTYLLQWIVEGKWNQRGKQNHGKK